MSSIASGPGTKPPLRKRHHLFSCREARWLLLTSLFLTNTIWFLFIPANCPKYPHPFTVKNYQYKHAGWTNVLFLLNWFLMMSWIFLVVLRYCLVKAMFSLLQYKPPLEVNDLFEDIKDGVKLLALLEVLSGQRLVSTHVWPIAV